MKYIVYVFALTALLFFSCDDEILYPPEKNYGITGKIYDDSGNPIAGVKIYYLFNYMDIPIYSAVEKATNNVSSADFGNKLYQNFSNPVYNSTFMRFSLDSETDLKFELKEKKSSKVIHSFSGRYSYGLYQHYFNKIVDSLDLENGMYIMELETSLGGTIKFKDQKTLVVASDLGKPNCFSDNNGDYLFNYSNAFIGDTINFTLDGENIYPNQVSNSVFLLFRKEGYYSKSVGYEIFPTILLNQDIVLYQELIR